MFSGRKLYNFGIAERLRALRYPIFTSGVVTGNGICNSDHPLIIAVPPVKRQFWKIRRFSRIAK